MKLTDRKILNYIIISSVIIILIFLFKLLFNGYWIWGGVLDMEATGQVGDFIGGVIGTILSVVGFYFLYITLVEQRKSIEIQRESFERERLESKFFELVKMHRENVSELQYDSIKHIENGGLIEFRKSEYEGKAVFNIIFNQFIDCRNELDSFFRMKRVYEPSYKDKLLSNQYVKENNLSLTVLAKIDICYSIVFYGVGSEGLLLLKEKFRGRYKEKFVNDILNFISLKPAENIEILNKWNRVLNKSYKSKKVRLTNDIIYKRQENKFRDPQGSDNDIIENYHNKFIKYYGGHQFRLGHYFRHLFQIVKYINEQEEIAFKVKYEYIKTLRAQLSTYEQAILLLNSLSTMGYPWEIQPEINTSLKSYNVKDFRLITKYNLIKNIPGSTIFGIDFRKIYPEVDYEGGDYVKKYIDYR